jgi:phenylacetate-coenzyme A ligase PaaK-like adenylate-forming protein
VSARGTPSLATRARSSAYVALHGPIQARFPFRSPAAIERAKQRRVGSMIEFAWRLVPYYKETMNRLGLTPADIQTDGDLAKLPILEPDQLQRDPEYFVSRVDPLERHIKIHTSGTGGVPRVYFRDTASVAKDAVHFTRLLAIAKRLAGKRIRLRQISIVRPVSSTTATVQDEYRAQSLFPSPTRVQHARLSLLEPLQRNVARINELKPDVIFTFGSYLDSLFLHLEMTGEPMHRPAAVIYSGDPLSGSARKRISERFGIHVLSAYSATEMPQVGFECEQHSGLHLNTDIYPLRIVDPAGEGLPPGEAGEVVVSNLVNKGTVLLNYRLGDIARQLPDRCACGRNLPLSSLPENRSEDWLITASGDVVHPQAASMWLEQMGEVRRFQVVQEAPTKFSVAIVAAPGSDRALVRDFVRRKFEETFGELAAVDVSFPDSLPRTSAGKVRPVISKVRARRSGPR